MDSLKIRLETADRALERLHEVTSKQNISDIERDGMIQRFEFCFELMWKCGKDYLREVEGLDAASPKKVIRLFRETGYFTDSETENFLLMADDRNLTAHTYDADLAKKMESNIREYEILLRKWFEFMSQGNLV